MRTGPHVPECDHGTPGPVRHKCVCAHVLEERRRALVAAWYVTAAAYVGPSSLRTELAALLRNINKTERRIIRLVDEGGGFHGRPGFDSEIQALEGRNARRQERVDQIRRKLLGEGS